ncbi:MAG: hypothetical protein IJP31_05660 [Lachnospiraceae bacterium]|nr:hypothetical protein [Lachnospiraceae bacterium]
MELQEFTDKVVRALEEFYGDDTRIESHEVYKNNGIKLQGICILMEGKNIAPTVYLNCFYEQYQRGTEFSDILSGIIALYEGNQVSQNLDIDFFLDYHKVKTKLVLRLIHREKNRELLEDIPYQPFQDLAVVCHCLIVNEAIGTGSVLIHKHHLESWGIDEEELFKAAEENSPRLQPVSIQKMGDMIKEIMGREVEEKVEEICSEYPQDKNRLLERTLEDMVKEIDRHETTMYVLTNQGRYYGASCILYEGVLEETAKKLKGDFYILPSSVHEVILVKKQGEDREEDLNEMVREVNASHVDPQEWLSDHAYLYQKEEKRIVSLD